MMPVVHAGCGADLIEAARRFDVPEIAVCELATMSWSSCA